MATKNQGTTSTGKASNPAPRKRGPSVNRVALIGRLSRDPELRLTANGVPVTRFTLVNNGTDGPMFNTIVAWRRLAEVSAEYLAKGRLVYVGGRLKGRRWLAPDGSGRYAIDIVADEIQFLSPRPAVTGAAA